MSESRPVIVLLGDSESERRELVKSLKSFNIGNEDAQLLLFIEFPEDAKRIEGVELLPSALIAIIAVDLRFGFQAAKKSVKKWLQVKDEIFPIASVYVVGTNLDLIVSDSSNQHISLTSNMCKLAAQKNAIYLELSCYDITNVGGIKALVDLIFLRLRAVAYEADRLAIFYDDPVLEDCANALSVARQRIEDIKADLMRPTSYSTVVLCASSPSNSSTKENNRADTLQSAISDLHRSFTDMGLEGWPLARRLCSRSHLGTPVTKPVSGASDGANSSVSAAFT